jgi:hypothetical protein
MEEVEGHEDLAQKSKRIRQIHKFFRIHENGPIFLASRQIRIKLESRPLGQDERSR